MSDEISLQITIKPAKEENFRNCRLNIHKQRVMHWISAILDADSSVTPEKEGTICTREVEINWQFLSSQTGEAKDNS